MSTTLDARYRVKNWPRFQHYSLRRPPWIRLHHLLTEDADFFALPGDDAKALVLIWLIASEDDSRQGLLPVTEKCAFRLRMTLARCQKLLETLVPQWLDRLTDTALAPCKQDASALQQKPSPETDDSETDITDNTETEGKLTPAVLKVERTELLGRLGTGFAETWSVWVSDRKTRKKPMTLLAEVLSLRKCAKWGSTIATSAIHTSIENGWSGIFEPKPDKPAFSFSDDPLNRKDQTE
jgi:hypothetical protein